MLPASRMRCCSSRIAASCCSAVMPAIARTSASLMPSVCSTVTGLSVPSISAMSFSWWRTSVAWPRIAGQSLTARLRICPSSLRSRTRSPYMRVSAAARSVGAKNSCSRRSSLRISERIVRIASALQSNLTWNEPSDWSWGAVACSMISLECMPAAWSWRTNRRRSCISCSDGRARTTLPSTWVRRARCSPVSGVLAIRPTLTRRGSLPAEPLELG